MPKRLILSSILKFGKVFLEVSKVPSRTRGGGVVKILGGVGVPFFLCVRFCCLDLVGYWRGPGCVRD